MRVMSVVGARPQFVKLAPIADACRDWPKVEHLIVHTGQHYDQGLSDVFFSELEIPAPDVHLGVGSASHGIQTGTMLIKLDAVLSSYNPDCVLVYGDTNSTLAAALVAVKQHIPLAHLEAGLRSHNRLMPEELNRVLVDHASDLLLAPTETAVEHLNREGLGHRTVLVGDVMTDVCLRTRDKVGNLPVAMPAGVDLSQPYIVATIHRAENTDNRMRLSAVIEAIQALSEAVLFVAHPRLIAKAKEFGVELAKGAVTVIPPLGYKAMIRVLLSAAGLVTDSGGLQKEAFLLGVPCTTLRTETEWTETLVDDWNVLSPGLERLDELAVRRPPSHSRQQPYGDGHAAVLTLEQIDKLVRRSGP